MTARTAPVEAIAAIDAADVVKGDLIVFLGQPHRVTRIEGYTGGVFADVPGVRIAFADEPGYAWSISLVPGCPVEVIR